MKKILPTFLLLGALTTLQKNAQAQNWQLYGRTSLPTASVPIGFLKPVTAAAAGATMSCRYYRRENATVENGQLVITAKRESFGGFNYTSASMKTAGRKSWKYGKIEARIKMPAFSGIWPAFWMLGDNMQFRSRLARMWRDRHHGTHQRREQNLRYATLAGQ